MWCDVVWVQMSFCYALARCFCYVGLLTGVQHALMGSFYHALTEFLGRTVRSTQVTSMYLI